MSRYRYTNLPALGIPETLPSRLMYVLLH